ncbi:hypothetical protein ACFCX0_03670 [Streptomyces sp. NPDC056352]|uniref:hypothetical protein n=1 Tax=Streptomyces sp. NPDC056352 TaxID=3345791 RepID=UPI0035D90F3C
MTATRAVTREQLLHLADRARRGVALDKEHDALTAGINNLCDRLELNGQQPARPRLAAVPDLAKEPA